MQNVILELHEDHKHIKMLLQKLTWETDRFRWKELVTEVSHEIELVLAAEEFAVYSRLLEGKKEKTIAKHYLKEHEEIRKSLHRLVKMEPDTNSAIETFAELRYVFSEHVSAVEDALFPVLEEIFDDDKMSETCRNYGDEKSRLRAELGPTNVSPGPHLGSPWSPPLREIV